MNTLLNVKCVNPYLKHFLCYSKMKAIARIRVQLQRKLGGIFSLMLFNLHVQKLSCVGCLLIQRSSECIGTCFT